MPEGSGAFDPSTLASSLTSYISTAAQGIGTVLTAGAVIVGAFYVWRVVKRALGASK